LKHDFWHQRWQQELIGFHQAETNHYLKKYIATLGLAPDDKLLVPLCGKSLDMWWLQEQGYKVLGVELSPIACEAFFTEAGRHPGRTSHGKFTSWKAEDVEILCGDFFNLGDDMTTDVRAVFDRAALIALPQEMRKAYVDHLAGILPSGTTGLLITMEYPQSEMQGPPFAVPPTEVETLFDEQFEVELLEDVDVLARNARFRDRGLSEMREQIFRFRRN
jgi:thiopurine S-methyltransferase